MAGRPRKLTIHSLHPESAVEAHFSAHPTTSRYNRKGFFIPRELHLLASPFGELATGRIQVECSIFFLRTDSNSGYDKK